MNNEDLNFLYLIDTLYEERSVSRAAEKLALTQPAVSHALRRLRVKFGDELFVRSGAGMTPTAIGERIALGARRALELIQTDIWDGPTFNPLKSTRTFAIGMTDMGGTIILPKVIKELSSQAPSVVIKPIASRPAEVSEMLEKGVIDLAWGFFGTMSDKLFQHTLFRRSLVGIIRKGGATAPIDLEAFVHREHVIASATALTNEILKEKLKELGRSLRIALEVPYLLAIPRIISCSNYIATVPDELAELFHQYAEIETFKLPLLVPDLAVKQYWHPRYNKDAGHQWLRSLVQRLFSA